MVLAILHCENINLCSFWKFLNMRHARGRMDLLDGRVGWGLQGLTLNLPGKMELYGFYMYYVVQNFDIGILKVNKANRLKAGTPSCLLLLQVRQIIWIDRRVPENKAQAAVFGLPWHDAHVQRLTQQTYSVQKACGHLVEQLTHPHDLFLCIFQVGKNA